MTTWCVIWRSPRMLASAFWYIPSYEEAMRIVGEMQAKYGYKVKIREEG